MENKKNLVFKKNDKKRMVVKCVDGCPFHIRTAKNRQAKTDWLGRQFMYTIRHTPEIKTKGLIAEAIKKWG
ncbi:unnamed protein product [Lathyrus sativus]|nr:unnamed protein product [Lathyrus sativus]